MNHPRLTAALCTVAVLGCAAAPAVFLAAADAASLGRVETVADPYVAPTPTADDYYILRQLAARSRNAESEREQRPAEVLTAPKMYIGASASLQSMQYADSAAAEAAENALRQLAETGAVPAAWAAEALDTAETGESYTDWDGKYYSLDATYCVTDSLGFVTVRHDGQFLRATASLWTAAPAQWSRHGSRWTGPTRKTPRCPPRPPCAALPPRPDWKASATGPPRRQPLRLRPLQHERRCAHHRLDPPLHLPGLRRYSAGFVRPLVLQPDPPAPHRGPAAGVGAAPAAAIQPLPSPRGRWPAGPDEGRPRCRPFPGKP
ncbi:hypothetical protein NIA69_03445 [Gemmiger formicilis]|nr:hypothetical protein [Gemmiger formicilis]